MRNLLAPYGTRTVYLGNQNYPARARALRALGLLLADGTPTVGGGRLFDGSAGFFYGNSCNSGTESRKMVSNVGN